MGVRPAEIPIGLLVSSTAKVLSREFDAALAAWLRAAAESQTVEEAALSVARVLLERTT